jgi:FixJ family two-component response regulator
MNSENTSATSDAETIAIIDDDPGVRASLLRLLSSMGYHTEPYDSAEVFLANVDRCKAGCLIIDVDLGDISGLDLARHPAITALKRPIIFHSARGDAELRRQAFALGCAAFLCKPYAAGELLAALVRAIEQRPTPYE